MYLDHPQDFMGREKNLYDQGLLRDKPRATHVMDSHIQRRENTVLTFLWVRLCIHGRDGEEPGSGNVSGRSRDPGFLLQRINNLSTQAPMSLADLTRNSFQSGISPAKVSRSFHHR